MITSASAVLAGSKINEDAAVSMLNEAHDIAFIAVADGASGLKEGNLSDRESEAQWLSSTLTDCLSEKFPDLYGSPRDLAQAIRCLRATKIGKIIESHSSMPPVASVSTVLLRDSQLSVTTLGDCDVLIEKRSGALALLPGDAVLGQLDAKAISVLRSTAKRMSVSPREARPAIDQILLEHRRLANQPGGYSALDLSGVGVNQAKHTTYPASAIRRIVVMSDGFRIGVGEERPYSSWKDVVTALDVEGIREMLYRVKGAMLDDPDWARYPRMSLCDDLSLAYIDLDDK